MDINELYFIPMRSGIPDAPLLTWDNDLNFFVDEQPVELIAPLSLCLSEPEPNKPAMADYLRLLSDAVVTQKIKNVLEVANISGMQLLPAKVKVNDGEYYDYWNIYIYHRIQGCIDLEKSEYGGDDESPIYMSRIFLDNDKLEKIPLEERLLFKLKEFPYREIFHKSIVDKIMSTSPTGIKFWSLTEWTETSYS